VAVDTARVSRPPPHRSPRAGRQPPNAGRAREQGYDPPLSAADAQSPSLSRSPPRSKAL